MDNNEILRQIKDNNIELIDFWYVDLLGRVKSITITLSQGISRLERLLDIGIRSQGASLYPGERWNSNNVTLIPDKKTFKILPWTVKEKFTRLVEFEKILKRNQCTLPFNLGPATARIFCNLSHEDRFQFGIFSSRDFLQERLRRLKSKEGYSYIVGPELEFHLFTPENKLIDKGEYLDIKDDAGISADIRQAIVLLCEELNFNIECHHHEVGNGQQEIDLEKCDALEMADKVLTYKALVKETARLFGKEASFMPKPFNDSQGNGMHVHQSLWRDKENHFHDMSMEFNLSDLGRSFAAGLLEHAQEITAITNQWVNSYKRIVPDFEAPVFIGWGPSNRSTLIRIPRLSPTGTPDSIRLEYRSPDPACNPYLTFAAMLEAGMDGVKKGRQLPRPIKENMYAIPKSEIEKKAIKLLPTSLGEALKTSAILIMEKRAIL